MPKVVKLTTSSTSGIDAQLAEIARDPKYTAAIRAKLGHLLTAVIEGADDKPVMAGDAVLLREVGDLLARAEELEAMMAAAKANGEVKPWITLSRLRDAQVATFRALCRDLGVTRVSLAPPAALATDKKAAQKSGAGWDGLL